MQVSSDGQFRYANSRWFAAALERLEKSGVHGMAVDVWVGAVPQSCLSIAYLLTLRGSLHALPCSYTAVHDARLLAASWTS